VVPKILVEPLQDKDTGKSQRVMKAMLQMKKLDIETLKRAAEQQQFAPIPGTGGKGGR